MSAPPHFPHPFGSKARWRSLPAGLVATARRSPNWICLQTTKRANTRTTKQKIHTSQCDDGNERRSDSNHQVRPRDFFQFTLQSMISSTPNAISS